MFITFIGRKDCVITKQFPQTSHIWDNEDEHAELYHEHLKELRDQVEEHPTGHGVFRFKNVLFEIYNMNIKNTIEIDSGSSLLLI